MVVSDSHEKRFAEYPPLAAPMPIKVTQGSLASEALPQRLLSQCQPDSPLGLFWINVRQFALFTRMFGSEAGDHVLVELAEILRSSAEEALPGHHLIVVEQVDRGSLALIFQNGPLELDQLMDHALKLRAAARYKLNQQLVPLTGQGLALEIGCSLVPSGGGPDLGVPLMQALDDARQMAEGPLSTERLSLSDEFRRLVGQPLVHSVYQPIVDLRRGTVLGWEALSRGPQEGAFSSPKAMFEFAEEAGALFQLERCCRQRAIEGLGGLAPEQKLFLNIHPLTLADPDFRSGETRRLLESQGLSPANVVFEITERHSIKDFVLFHRTLDHYRSQGFQVAIDDVGTGFSGLSRLARLRPDFIKVDMGLVQGAHSNPVQRALLETMITFAEKIGSSVIAEGIENESDLSCLVSMGMHFGQGFHLGRPQRVKGGCDPQVVPRIQGVRPGAARWRCAFPIRQLVEDCPRVAPGTKTRAVKHLLDNQPISAVVVVHDGIPLGLVMSHHLDRQLGTPYGSALYYDRAVDMVMDPSPLVVEASSPVEKVARQATSREVFKLYDQIVVIEEGRYLGTVSVQKMLDALARAQVEMAKGASPLTGLPGGLTLEAELERRCNAEARSGIIYADLDNFKVYNDVYGFKAGDRMIRLTADILAWACRRHAGEGAYLGHVGGDDFLVFCDADRAERFCLAVVRCFGRLVRGLYTPEDAERGHVEAKGRDGKQGRFPLVSISLGIVDCVGGGCDLQQLAQRAAEVKRWAKSLPGNVWVRDRRGPLNITCEPYD